MAIIDEEAGNIFLAPSRSVIIHACNARGVWGTGVAFIFKQKYPSAFRVYNRYCQPPTGSNLSKNQHQANLIGTALLIPPPGTPSQQQASSKPSHYIACLFTSLDYGNHVSPAEEILENTRNALGDLAKKVAERRQSSEEVGKCYAVKINSGNFGVPWQSTKAVMEAGDLDITVVSPEGEEGAGGEGSAAGEKLVQPSETVTESSTSSNAARAGAGKFLDNT